MIRRFREHPVAMTGWLILLLVLITLLYLLLIPGDIKPTY